ncbi:MAG: hypothetical protein LBS29_05725 [Endomicrobium sp.]|nr:hypothetical protein [Endomicrobium sp.]MDR2396151.1 hypothetical protein [Endomicrobium sp.]
MIDITENGGGSSNYV